MFKYVSFYGKLTVFTLVYIIYVFTLVYIITLVHFWRYYVFNLGPYRDSRTNDATFEEN